jgi:hypothetical protein
MNSDLKNKLKSLLSQDSIVDNAHHTFLLLNMSMPEDKTNSNWDKFSNPESLKSNLITASLYLAAYEILRASVIDSIRDFFTCGFNDDGDVVSKNIKTKYCRLTRVHPEHHFYG